VPVAAGGKGLGDDGACRVGRLPDVVEVHTAGDLLQRRVGTGTNGKLAGQYRNRDILCVDV
jgi:hypothetical protein